MVDRTKKFRPAPGGVSIGHYQITAGTLGCWTTKAGEFFILSNNHVLANVGDCEIGDPILQPGVADGGTEKNDEIAKLYDFVPISLTETSGCPFANAIVSVANFFARLFRRKTQLKAYIPGEPNKVDCALASPNSDKYVLERILEDDGSFVKIEGEAEAEIGLLVKKSGRTTGTTHGEISQTDVTIIVNMGDGRMAIFTDQIVVEKEGMSAGGDSGSVVLTEHNSLVGLLFAGSDKAMIANSWKNVKKALVLD
jgi:hypothetical protein